MGMDSSTTQHHHQEMGSETLESMLVCSKPQQEKKPRPADMESLKCPRCDSINTKFCYYNNYSLSQPRYFCKSCRRYWTKGGTLRNVPVGGGCRKNKRSSSSSPSPSSSSRRLINQDHPIMMTSTNPTPNTSVVPLSYDHHSNSNDLSLAIARLQKQASGPMGLDPIWGNPNMPHHGDGNLGLLDAIRSGFLENGVHQNLYYGMGNGCMGMENGGMGMSESREMGIPYEELISGTTTSTAVKEEMCVGVGVGVGGGREGETKGLFGFPWQNIGSNEMTEFDSGRLGWNGIGSSSWHGLLNSPLM